MLHDWDWTQPRPRQPGRLDESLPDAVAQWVEESGCRLGLGDGEGLNFVVGDADLGRSLDLGGAAA